MERIDHSNYEAWLLDRLEGNLSDAQERLLDAFLLQHPELDIHVGELPTVSDDRSVASELDKEELKRHIPPVAPVSRTNVVDHLIARAEGDLDAAGEKALDAFLVAHPEYQRTARIIELARVESAGSRYQQKSELYRRLPPTGAPSAFNVNDFLVARLEGDLDAEQEKALDLYLASDPEAAHSMRILSHTRVAATAIPFPDKASLKKGARVILFAPNIWVRLSAAATVLVVLTMGLWFLRTPSAKDPRIAEIPTRPNNVAAEVAEDQGLQEVLVGPAPLASVSGGSSVVNNQGIVPDKDRNVVVKASSDRLAGTMPMQRVIPSRSLGDRTPVDVAVPEIKETIEDPSTLTAPSGTTASMTVPELLASTLRERVLETPSKEPRPLDVDDAVAAVDLGLKAVSGDLAGLEVERKESGGLRRFNLRLGRNFEISAHR